MWGIKICSSSCVNDYSWQCLWVKLPCSHQLGTFSSHLVHENVKRTFNLYLELTSPKPKSHKTTKSSTTSTWSEQLNITSTMLRRFERSRRLFVRTIVNYFITSFQVVCVIRIYILFHFRKRREEKSRRSQHIEETFSERLANRSVAGKSSSRVDVGFTSQQTLNDDQEDKERRPTLSRFFKLWKGLRNSKRKSANEESTRSVVFTIPTEDVFPRSKSKTMRI